MAARIGLVTGNEWVVDQSVDEAASNMVGADPFVVIEAQDVGRVYLFRAHVAYVKHEGESVYERRGMVST